MRRWGEFLSGKGGAGEGRALPWQLGWKGSAVGSRLPSLSQRRASTSRTISQRSRVAIRPLACLADRIAEVLFTDEPCEASVE